MAYLSCFNPRICKRCDGIKRRPNSGLMRFNPRICKRCDKTVNAYLFTVNVVSIHASVKDATLVIIRLFLMVSFNPRICKRCDIRFWYWWRLSLVSIHASVKDATCRPYYGYSYCHSFNPRICKRCDSFFHFIKHFFLSFNPRICKRCDYVYDK